MIAVHHGAVPQEKDTIRFVCLSDTHTHTDNLKVPSGDVLLHAGDWSYVGALQEIIKFNNFLKLQPHPYKIVISGNHEVTFDHKNFDKMKERFSHLINRRYGCDFSHSLKEKLGKDVPGFYYLEDSSLEIEEYKLYGSPWSRWFNDWGFNLMDEKESIEVWNKIPPNTDILMTHGPAKGKLDLLCGHFFDTGTSRPGCPVLLDKVKSIQPLVHIFGHVHESYGVLYGKPTTYINASICDRSYSAVNKPWVFDLPLKKVSTTCKKVRQPKSEKTIINSNY